MGYAKRGGPMKRCTKCGIEKEFERFGPDKRRKDGLQSHCRECMNKHRAQYSRTDAGKQTGNRAVTCYRKTTKYVIARQKRDALYSSKYRKYHPDRVSAHDKVKYAVRIGALTAPEKCEHCGGNREIGETPSKLQQTIGCNVAMLHVPPPGTPK